MPTHQQRLRTPEFDGCGIGFVADTAGSPSRLVVDLALGGLSCVRHRAAVAADGLSGDGAGILAPLPRPFFARVGSAAIGRPLDETARRRGVRVLGPRRRRRPHDRRSRGRATRAPPRTSSSSAGGRCRSTNRIWVATRSVTSPPSPRGWCCARRGSTTPKPNGAAYRARRRAEACCRDAGVRHYFASWSFTTVTYKALVISDRLAGFFPDLGRSGLRRARTSCSTAASRPTPLPAWERAQPFRHVCHNGEINTLAGNEHRMLARGHLGTEAVGLGSEELLRPLLDPDGSDSAKLDHDPRVAAARRRDAAPRGVDARPRGVGGRP